MLKERYRKANDQIPLNEELLGTLLETAEKTCNEKKHYGFGLGTVAAAAIIGIGIFSYSYLKGDLLSDPVAEGSEPKTKLAQESQAEPSPTVMPETEFQTEEALQQPVIIVATEETVTEKTELFDERNEDIANIPATASAVMPRAIPSEEQPEETDPSISQETEEPEVIDEQNPPTDESGDQTEGSEPENDEEGEQTVQESPTPTSETVLTELE